jgi:hypothetical protein
MGINHASFPFDESPWISHFHDADDSNQRAQIGMAGAADDRGDDSFAKHIMSANPGENPFANYGGPFGEGLTGKQFTPNMPNHQYEQYFGDYRAPGADAGSAGPYTDPRKIGPAGGVGPAVTGNDYLKRLLQQGGGGDIMPAGGMYQ